MRNTFKGFRVESQYNEILKGTGNVKRGENVFRSFHSTRLKIRLVGLFRLSPTSVHILLPKTKLNSNIASG